MPTISPHNVAVRPSGDVAVSIVDVTPDFQTRAHAYVFDLKSQTKLGDFPVRYETMGGVRHDLSGDDSICLVGCYEAHGLAAYSIPDGKEIWRRKDLKTAQQVAASPFQPLVFCGRETGAAHVLNIGSGETVEKLAGVNQMFWSPYDESVLVVGRKIELHRPFGTRVAVLVPENDWVFELAFSQKQVVLRTAASVACFGTDDGRPLWIVPERRSSSLSYDRFCFSSLKGTFDWLENLDGKEAIRSLDSSTGTVVQSRSLDGPASRKTFCKDGALLFGATLELRSAATGGLVHDFCTDEILKKDRHFKPPVAKVPVSEERVRELEELIARLEQKTPEADSRPAEDVSTISRQPVPRSN